MKDILIPTRWLGEVKDKTLQIRNNSISLLAWLRDNLNIDVPIVENFFRYPKDETLGEAQIGLLAMHTKTPLVYSGPIVLTLNASIFSIIVSNVEDGSFTAEDEISDEENEATVISVTDLGEGVFELIIDVTSGDFSESESITNGTATADVVFVSSNQPEVGDSITLFDESDEEIVVGEITEIDENSYTATLDTIETNLEDIKYLIVSGETYPAVFSVVDIENSTIPEITGGSDIATLCQTEVVGEGVQMVANMVLGEIVGIDGDDVLINPDFSHKVVLEEGNSVDVYNHASSPIPNFLYAWDGGKVITKEKLSEIIDDSEVEAYITRYAYFTNGIYSAITSGNGDVEGSETVKVIKALPYTEPTE